MLKINEFMNVGNAKYVVSYCTGKKHSDGSDFYDIAIFSNRKKKDAFIAALTGKHVKCTQRNYPGCGCRGYHWVGAL